LIAAQVANFDEMSPSLRPPQVVAARPVTLDGFFEVESRLQRGEFGETAQARFDEFQVAVVGVGVEARAGWPPFDWCRLAARSALTLLSLCPAH
jgi:hypothetical protein